ncbi:MAG: signal peptide peptidase SppA [Spirochaetales bacterium]|nr:signal peptide peptidase SppA [Spirochaetales bacterium]
MIVFRILLLPLRLLFYFLYYIRDRFPGGNVLLHRLPDRFVMVRPTGLLSYFIPATELHFMEYLGLLHVIRQSKQVRRLVLMIPEMDAPWNQVAEIHGMLRRIKESGKEIIAYSDGGNLKSLYLMTAADRRLAPESAAFTSAFPSAEPFFLRGLLDKLGVKVESFTAGKYKSAAEMFTRHSYSQEARRALTHVLSDLSSQIEAMFPDKKVRQLLKDQLLIEASDLKRAGFLEDYLEEGEIKVRLCGQEADGGREHPYLESLSDQEESAGTTTNGEEEEEEEEEETTTTTTVKWKLTTELALARRYRRREFRPLQLRRRPSFAVLALEGPITMGRSGQEPHAAGIEALALCATIDALGESPEAAVIVYINSPGGSAQASEILYQALRRLGRKKPVLAFMGSVAASGGYYLACAAHVIYASPLTITGSIGVVTIRPQLEKLYRRLGIKRERVHFQKTRDLFSESRPLSSASRKLLVDTIRSTYQRFLDRVGSARKVKPAALRELAEGRIWTGKQFAAHKMLDDCTDFLTIMEETKKRLGIAERTSVGVNFYPQVKTNLRTVIGEHMPGIPGLAMISLWARKIEPLYYFPLRIE